MNTKKATVVFSVTLAAIAGSAFAGGAGNPGPDVIVGDLRGVNYYGQSGGFTGHSVGTESCNLGTERANWIDGTPFHPVIAQNLYKISDGRMEQISMAWLKHSFASLQDNLCAVCQPGGDFSHLGVNCSDFYSASLNGDQGGMGGRFEVNATNGVFPWPYSNPGGVTGPASFKRIQTPVAKLTTGNGEVYVLEGQYATQDDSAAGNHYNNASYRLVTLNPTFSMTMNLGATVRETAAIQAWHDHGNGVNTPDNDVVIQEFIVPNEGLFHVAGKATDNGDGTWRYDYNIHNQNSHASAGSISIPTNGATTSNHYFNAPHYHSGDPVGVAGNTPWTVTEGAGSISWSTDAWTLANDQSANAVRWATMYTYSFVANSAPQDGTVHVGLFRPGTAITGFDVTLPVPSAANAGCNDADLAEPFGQLDFSDVVAFLAAFGAMDAAADIAEPFGQWDFSDVVAFLAAFGAGCP